MPKVECRSCPWFGNRKGDECFTIPCPKCGAKVAPPQRLTDRRVAIAKADLQRYGLVPDAPDQRMSK